MKHASITRRHWLKLASVAGATAVTTPLCSGDVSAAETGGIVDIGSRRELFVDEYLIEKLHNARRVLHHPTPREISLARNKPWEGNSSGYTTVFQDGDLYRMYYRGTHVVYARGKSERAHREVYCYAESRDGFVSVKGPLAGGELITKPLCFEGGQLQINFSTSAAGSVAVEIQDQAGKPVPGFALADCHLQYGDQLDRVVSWKSGADVSRMVGKPVKLRFHLKDADLYAFRFAAGD